MKGKTARRARVAEQEPQFSPLASARPLDPLCEDGVAHVVHDMKSPLTTIALETALLDHRLANGDRAGVSVSLGRISDNVMYLDRMVHDLLDVASITNGKLALMITHCELHTLIENVVERMVPTRDQHRVFVEMTERVVVLADDLRIERVLSNLIDNALKYTPPSSGVVIRMLRAGNEARISVTDAGPGMSPSELANIFDPFTRAESSHGRTGSGLGLYVSKKIVEAHGGQIGIESVRGVGSRFFFSLPTIT